MAMDVGSVINQGLIGMQRSQQEIQRSAQQIAEANVQPAGGSAVSTVDLAEPLVNMMVQQQVFDSSAKVVDTAQEMLGRLIDTKA